MTQDTPYVYLNKDYENDASNIEAKPETDKRPRRGFLRLSSVLPTSRVFTSGYVNTETMHFTFLQYQPPYQPDDRILHISVISSQQIKIKRFF